MALPGSPILPTHKRIPALGACVDPELTARCSRSPGDVAFSKTTNFLPCFPGKERLPLPGALNAGSRPSRLGQPGVQAWRPRRASQCPASRHTRIARRRLRLPAADLGARGGPILIEIPLNRFGSGLGPGGDSPARRAPPAAPQPHSIKGRGARRAGAHAGASRVKPRKAGARDQPAGAAAARRPGLGASAAWARRRGRPRQRPRLGGREVGRLARHWEEPGLAACVRLHPRNGNTRGPARPTVLDSADAPSASGPCDLGFERWQDQGEPRRPRTGGRGARRTGPRGPAGSNLGTEGAPGPGGGGGTYRARCGGGAPGWTGPGRSGAHGAGRGELGRGTRRGLRARSAAGPGWRAEWPHGAPRAAFVRPGPAGAGGGGGARSPEIGEPGGAGLATSLSLPRPPLPSPGRGGRRCLFRQHFEGAGAPQGGRRVPRALRPVPWSGHSRRNARLPILQITPARAGRRKSAHALRGVSSGRPGPS